MTPPHGPSDRPLLAVRGLTVSFARENAGPARAVEGVGFRLYPDQTLAIVGESGSGKSVTALSILRLLPEPPANIEAGDATLGSDDGTARDLFSLAPPELRRVRGGEIAMIFQEPMTSLNPLLTVGDQVAEAVEVHTAVGRREARDRAVAALVEVGISDAPARVRAYPHEFSGGMRQRVMIAMALACRPRVLLADEPTTALDVTTQAQILDLIDDARRQRRMGVVLITHDLGVVARRAEVLCVMYAGRVVEYGPTRAVLASPLHPYTRGLLACRPTPGSRQLRLTTVRELIDSPVPVPALPRSAPTLRPWWPGHSPPPGLPRDGNASVLVEASENRWFRAWATPEALSLPQREPDVPVRRIEVGTSAAAV